jgi:acetoin utilization protein AcuB
MKKYLVKDWMISDVMSTTPKSPMLEAHKMMRQHNVRRMPVVKKGKVVGIITRSDVRQAEPSDATSLNVWEVNYLLSKLRVRDIMTKDPLTIGPEESIKQAASIMYENQIGALPVVGKGGKLVGILTESDIFRILISWLNEEMDA